MLVLARHDTDTSPDNVAFNTHEKKKDKKKTKQTNKMQRRHREIEHLARIYDGTRVWYVNTFVDKMCNNRL